MDFNSWENYIDRSDKTIYHPKNDGLIVEKLNALYLGMEKAKQDYYKNI